MSINEKTCRYEVVYAVFGSILAFSEAVLFFIPCLQQIQHCSRNPQTDLDNDAAVRIHGENSSLNKKSNDAEKTNNE